MEPREVALEAVKPMGFPSRSRDVITEIPEA